MTTYRPGAKGRIADIRACDRMNDQVIIDAETDPEIICPNGVFCLELLKAVTTGTVVVADGNGVTVLTYLNSFNQEHSPIRLNNGIIITGDVEHVKGYVIEGVLRL